MNSVHRDERFFNIDLLREIDDVLAKPDKVLLTVRTQPEKESK